MSINNFFVEHILDFDSYQSRITRLHESCWENFPASIVADVVYIEHILCNDCPLFYYYIRTENINIIRTTINPFRMREVSHFINTRSNEMEEFIEQLFDVISENSIYSMWEILRNMYFEPEDLVIVNRGLPICLHIQDDSHDSGIESTAGPLKFNSLLHGFFANSYGFVNAARWQGEKGFDQMISNWVL